MFLKVGSAEYFLRSPGNAFSVAVKAGEADEASKGRGGNNDLSHLAVFMLTLGFPS